MPGRDGTGPLGAGPMTGRGAGFCAGFDAPGYVNAVPGRGFRGRGFGCGGGGRGWRNGYRATGQPGWMRFGWNAQGSPPVPPAEAEQASLQAQATILQEQLDVIKKRLDALSPDVNP